MLWWVNLKRATSVICGAAKARVKGPANADPARRAVFDKGRIRNVSADEAVHPVEPAEEAKISSFEFPETLAPVTEIMEMVWYFKLAARCEVADKIVKLLKRANLRSFHLGR